MKVRNLTSFIIKDKLRTIIPITLDDDVQLCSRVGRRCNELCTRFVVDDTRWISLRVCHVETQRDYIFNNKVKLSNSSVQAVGSKQVINSQVVCNLMMLI